MLAWTKQVRRLAAAGVIFSMAAYAQDADRASIWDASSTCIQRPKDSPIVGRCFWVHGRARLSGQGAACTGIWRIGTKRVLHVCEDLPKNAETLLNDQPANHESGWIYGNHVFGEYLVCPLDADVPGAARHVCVARAENLKLVHH